MTMFGDRVANREVRRQMARESAKLPKELQIIAKHDWPQPYDAKLKEVWRSRDYLVQVFEEDNGIKRLSVCKTTIDPRQGRWEEGITWEDLQRLKREAGFGLLDAVEVYPADAEVVNVANMRHLWIMPLPLAFKWTRK